MARGGRGGTTFSPNDNCNRDCADCIPHFMPVHLILLKYAIKSKLVSDDRARDLAQRLAGLAQLERQHIRNRLPRYENAVRSKWRNMSKAEREGVVLRARPSLYPHKFPEQRLRYTERAENFEGTINDAIAVSESRNEPRWLSIKQRNGLLIPYLNVETLVEDPERLLGLLHHRSNSNLEDWVSFEAEQFNLGFHHGWLADQFNDNCVIMYGQDYGRLVDWDRVQCHSKMMIGYPLAKLVLEAQSILYGFLSKALELLIDPGMATEESAVSYIDFKASEDCEFCSKYSNQLFSAPPTFNPQQCLEEARAHLSEAEDHLLLLQTDPAYLQRSLDLRNAVSSHPTMSLDELWQSHANDMLLVIPTQQLRNLRLVVDQCEHLVALHQEYKDSLSPSSPLPQRYEIAMSGLDFHCHVTIDSCSRMINRMLLTTESFAHHFVHMPDQPGVHKFKIQLERPDVDIYQKLFYSDPLLWALMTLISDHLTINEFNKSLAMRFLDECMADPKQKRRINPATYTLLSRFALCHSILAKLRHHRPLAGHLNVEAGLEPHLAARYMGWQPKLPGPYVAPNLGTLLRKVCQTPWPKGKRDEAWLEEATAIRQRMADLWLGVRDIIQTVCSFSQGGRLLPEDLEKEVDLVSADLKPEYEAEKLAEADAVRRCMAARDAARNAAVKASKDMVHQTLWGDDRDEKFEPAASRTKEKTRPEKAITEDVDEQAAQLAALEIDDKRPPPDCIEVSPESIRLFSRMFFSNEDMSTGGKIVWKDLVTAMADAGFAATHCGGSAVSFDPVEGAPMKGSIVFHKPHLEPNVDSVMLHIMGKRLRKWFGWSRETFVEREKKGDGSKGWVEMDGERLRGLDVVAMLEGEVS